MVTVETPAVCPVVIAACAFLISIAYGRINTKFKTFFSVVMPYFFPIYCAMGIATEAKIF